MTEIWSNRAGVNVSAIIVTRGDVDYTQVFKNIPLGWEILVWNNGSGECERWNQLNWYPFERIPASDLSVYGRYAAIEYATHDLIYVQDDDCVVSDPQQIANAAEWMVNERSGHEWNTVVCNMPPEYRHSFYSDCALVGFGACFHRDAPQRAWEKAFPVLRANGVQAHVSSSEFFQRECDLVFTALTPRVLVNVPKKDLPWFDAPNRLWTQKEHVGERTKMLNLVKEVIRASSD